MCNCSYVVTSSIEHKYKRKGMNNDPINLYNWKGHSTPTYIHPHYFLFLEEKVGSSNRLRRSTPTGSFSL